MSSPITFSGFNSIDFNQVLNAIMQQASQPLAAIQNKQTAIRSQVTSFDLFANRLAALKSAAADLGDLTSLNGFSGTSSDPDAVSVSTSAGAAAVDFDVVVNSLARAQVTASTTTSPDSNTTVVASGGSLTINGVDVTVAGDVTLQGLADAINATADIGVRASVVRTGTTAYRLVLTSEQPGLASAFTVTNNLTGGAGVAFGANAVEASDASLVVNGIAVTGSTNTFEDIIPGVTLTAKAASASTVHITVAPDSSALEAKLDDFIEAYNEVVKFLGEQRADAAEGKASSIGREPLLRQLHTALRMELVGAHGTDLFTRLSEVGVELTSTGTMELDSHRLSEAVAEDADAVRELFAGTDGAFSTIETTLAGYTQSNGYISTAKQQLTDQIKKMDNQIVAMQARLAIQREGLLREFIAADQAMSRLKDQSSSLSTFGSAF
jgi:flagellar hook-associated protein 2